MVSWYVEAPRSGNGCFRVDHSPIEFETIAKYHKASLPYELLSRSDVGWTGHELQGLHLASRCATMLKGFLSFRIIFCLWVAAARALSLRYLYRV